MSHRALFLSCLVLLAGSVAGCAAAGAAGTRARAERRIREIVERPGFETSTFGVLAVREKDGQVLAAHNADRLLPAASNIKLASAAGALLALGPDFRFETRIVAAGPIEDGILAGDLVLVASGDPNLSQRATPDGKLLWTDRDHSYAGFHPAELVEGDPLRVVKDLARQVAGRGIREVRGAVIVDDGLFLERSDEFVGPISAVCVNDNLVDVTVRPGESVGALARVEILPRSPVLGVTSAARTVPAGEPRAVWVEPLVEPRTEPPPGPGPGPGGDPGDGGEGGPPGGASSPGVPPAARFVVRGEIPIDSEPVLRVAPFPEPARVAAGFLAEELRALGVSVRGAGRPARLGPAGYEGREVLARHLSPPLSEAVRVALKVSHNLHATMLLAAVGAVAGEGGDRYRGYRVLRDVFSREGLDVTAASLQTGAGGGRADLLTPRWTVELLRRMARREEFPAFLDALPIGGVDGTLASAFRTSPLRGRVHAKTGTLVYRSALSGQWVFVSKALSGYVDPGGERDLDDRIVFSIIISNTLASDRREGARRLVRAQEKILEALLD